MLGFVIFFKFMLLYRKISFPKYIYICKAADSLNHIYNFYFSAAKNNMLTLLLLYFGGVSSRFFEFGVSHEFGFPSDKLVTGMQLYLKLPVRAPCCFNVAPVRAPCCFNVYTTFTTSHKHQNDVYLYFSFCLCVVRYF